VVDRIETPSAFTSTNSAFFVHVNYFRLARQNVAASAADAAREVVERWLPSS
jgi:hypothetical protein